jgi:hypothetical protein
MTKGDLDGLRCWGRPVKPVALGLSFLMLTLTVSNVANVGVFEALWLGDVVAVMAGSAALLLIGGWVLRSQRSAEWGLLLACVVYIVRSSFLFFLVGPGEQGVWLSLGAATIAGGAYLLETTDEQAEWRWRRKHEAV